MKKTCFVLLCALLLGLAPTTFAAGRALLSLDGLLTGVEPEGGAAIPVGG